MYHRVLYTARYLLRSGVEDGQYIPDIGLCKEFEKWFFRKGSKRKADFENRWFFYYVRECIVQFRRDALHVDYEPWKDNLLDLGGPDSCDEFEVDEGTKVPNEGHSIVYGDEVDNWGDIINPYQVEKDREVEMKNEK